MLFGHHDRLFCCHFPFVHGGWQVTPFRVQAHVIVKAHDVIRHVTYPFRFCSSVSGLPIPGNPVYRPPAQQPEQAVLAALQPYLQETNLQQQLTTDPATTLRQLVQHITVQTEQLVIHLHPDMLQHSTIRQISVPITIRQNGRSRQIRIGEHSQPDATLTALLAKAHRWQNQLKEKSISAIAVQEKVSASYVTRVLYLSFLSPDIVEKLVQGRQPAHLNASWLMQAGPPPVNWQEQHRWAGIPQ